uniref:Aminotransferase-like plant mobile domain-containing protein n=1 Tax=Fagus sylvatica TaxID=28930 RepID=A0A2N9FEA1_FAGSY
MSDQGNGSGGHRRSSLLVKGKAVAHAPESSPNTDDEYDALEDPRTRANRVVAGNLQWFFDVESDNGTAEEVRPPPRASITIGGSTKSSGAPRCSSRMLVGVRYPPQGGILPRHTVTTLVANTPLLTNLVDHPSSSVRRYEPHPRSSSRDGWSDFHKLLAGARREYRDFLMELGFGPFLSIPYMSLSHPLVSCLVERFFHHTGTFHLSTCEMGVLPVDWNAILGIRFSGKAPPSERISSPKALAILGLSDLAACDGTTNIVLRAFEHFPSFRPNRLQSAPDPTFPLARRWDSTQIKRLTVRTLLECRTIVDCIRDEDVIFQPYTFTLVGCIELGLEVGVPMDPPLLMTIKDYIPATPGDAYLEGVDYFPDLIRIGELYQEWFMQNSLGSLMTIHEEEAAARAMSVQRLEDQLLSLGVTPITRASSSNCGRTSPSSSPSPAHLPRD